MISRFLFMAGLLVCLAIPGVAQDEAKTSARNEVDDGVQAFRQAHYEDAIGHFEQAVTLDPDLVVARMYLAATYMQVFEPGIDTPENVILATKALDQYSEILRSNPSDIESLKGLAYLKLQLNNFDEAKQAYTKAIALDPGDPDLLYAAAVANWSNANRVITAEKAKLDAETEYSLITSEGCAELRARSLADIDSAIAMLNKAISLRKENIDAMTYMDMLYRLRADVECGSKKNFKADVKQSDEWADRAAAARKKQAETPATDDQEKPPDKPRL
ncbi:MAG TPA: tetratricopeptide repeat protein [Candidatus Binatia bacterium]|nr:tetratricopeptide repeat protein [Candidatus Binatia bacterium]